MRTDNRVSLLLVAPALLAVAIAGYLIGHRRPSARSSGATHEASNGVVSVTYPAGWEPVRGTPAMPGLAVGLPLVLAPAGHTGRAALVVGQLTVAHANPLPTSFLADLTRVPDAEVVDLPNGQAYRYSQLAAPGFATGFTLYAIPETSTSETVAICYSPTPSASAMHACEGIAATLTLLSPAVEVQAGGYLTPKANYARSVKAALDELDRQRRELRPGILPGVARASAAELATSLAEGFSHADSSLAVVQPPPAALSAHHQLLEALSRGRRAYAALATAVSDGDSSAYAAAETQIDSAEAALASSLQSFALIGYR
jgi:hypothetical protein